VVPAVEGNTTFYALPSRDTAQKWADAVPDDFRFMFKFSRSITHERKLRNCGADVETFFEALEPCLSLMEPVAIQLPASFGPTDIGALDQFLSSLPQITRYAVEVRHPGFFDGGNTERDLNDLLYERSTDRIILDSRAVFAGPRLTPAENDAFENKPRLPVRAVATNDRPVVRFIGQTAFDANPPFWRPWVDTVARWLEDERSPTVFLHTPDNVVAIDLARRFYDDVRILVPMIPPLAETPPVDAPALFD
jgi:uncharacterized protein YecE (DUF72 family)